MTGTFTHEPLHLLFLKCFHDFHDIQGRRTFLYASSASHTGIHPVVVGREIDQLMHEALTEPLLLRGPVVSVSHHGEIRIHAGIPAAVSLYPVSGIVVLNVIALTGGAYKRTGTAGQAGFIKLLPHRRLEFFHQHVPVPSFQRKIGVREFFYNSPDLLLLFSYSRFASGVLRLLK